MPFFWVQNQEFVPSGLDGGFLEEITESILLVGGLVIPPPCDYVEH